MEAALHMDETIMGAELDFAEEAVGRDGLEADSESPFGMLLKLKKQGQRDPAVSRNDDLILKLLEEMRHE